MRRYTSHFSPVSRAEAVMRSGRMIDPEETPAMMVERVVETLAAQELDFTGDFHKAETFRTTLGNAMDRSEVIMSTPIMTNAGRYVDKPLTACTVPTIDLRQCKTADLKREITTLHEQGMGTGFNLNDVDNPTEMLGLLNAIAKESARSGKEDRPVGNMAVLSVYHPDIRHFIAAKRDVPRTGEDWKFNISVDVDAYFMGQLESGGYITLWNGRKVSSQKLFDEICAAAIVCADPGLVFLDRMNARNPLPGLGEYKTTAPCAEVGLIEGETCQFGSINIGKFVKRVGSEPLVDYECLRPVVHVMMHALDDALEISCKHFITACSRYIAVQKRKVGIGICGVADALTIAGLSYDSTQARALMRDILSFINFASKEESIRLSEARGACGAMNNSLGNRHLSEPPLLDHLYGDQSTGIVSGLDWRTIAARIATTRQLRNISTIALPPTGRSALVIDASTGIEPHFSVPQANAEVLGVIRQDLARICGETEAENIIRNGYAAPANNGEVHRLLASAREIEPAGHIGMAAALQEITDEAISKTINVPEGTTQQQAAHIYLCAYRCGMSGVTIYVDGTHKLQPKKIK